jgi:hypothetical protein
MIRRILFATVIVGFALAHGLALRKIGAMAQGAAPDSTMIAITGD